MDRNQRGGPLNRFPPRSELSFPNRNAFNRNADNRYADNWRGPATPLSEQGRLVRAVGVEPKSVLLVSEMLLNKSVDERSSLCLVGIDNLEQTNDNEGVGNSKGSPRLSKLVERINVSWADDNGVVVHRSVVALVDSGAEVSCIHTNIVNIVNTRGNRRPIATAGGAILAEVIPEVTVRLRNFTLKVDLVVLPLGAVEMILGMDILSAVGAIISCSPPSLALAATASKGLYIAEPWWGGRRGVRRFCIRSP